VGAHAGPGWALAVAWSLVVVGAGALFIGYDAVSDPVPLYRSPFGDPVTAPKSVFTVGRLVGLGVAQVGAATSMVGSSVGSPWRAFWRWLALVAGIKACSECLSFVASGGVRSALTGVAVVAVATFLAVVLREWRRVGRPTHPSLGVVAKLGVFLSFVIWVVCALGPALAF
jgi:hypothetical protein